ncbi:MAG: hypothetical protein JW909_11220 [Planctomycetes bacterium]|nr:hypothetical protein [Planctomycetota bacterium]
MSRLPRGEGAVRRFEMMDFEAESRRVLAGARAEARGIAAEAQKQAASIREAARREGYAAGLREGGEAGLKEGRAEGARRAEQEFVERSKDLSNVLEGMLSEFAARREGILEQVRSEAMEFLIACVERIVRREVSMDRLALERALADGLAMVTSSPVTVEINPGDLGHLRRVLPEILAEEPVEGVKTAAVKELAPGDVRLRHPEGSIDLSLDAQMAVLRAAFLGGRDGAV